MLSCAECGELCINDKALRQHKYSFHGAGSVIVKCNFCSLEDRKQKIFLHQLRCDAQPAQKCVPCGKELKNMRSLRVHEKSHAHIARISNVAPTFTVLLPPSLTELMARTIESHGVLAQERASAPPMRERAEDVFTDTAARLGLDSSSPN